MKVLIIEDEIEILSAARKYLDSKGYVCEEASTLEEGIIKITRCDYDCIVADIGLPDGNGLSLINELKTKTP